ncbi:cytochrome P450 monooxygenase [Aspergillus pseudoustus]|uniref:Cytochrome P450 monooxygenase n=1 Tax=Aspergillus pseudoustus TaxID=1810923 RepID=A0ABR4ING4_9EURO
MDIPLLAGGLAVAFALYHFVLSPMYLSPLAKIPSAHPLASISSLWILWKRYHSQENATVHAAHEKYGPVVRLGPRDISVNCIKGGIQTIYTGGFDKHDFYSTQFHVFGLQNMFSMEPSKPHAARKRHIASAYTKSHITSSPTMSANTKVLIHDRFLLRLSQIATHKLTVDLYKLFKGLLVDFITVHMFGLARGSNMTIHEEHLDELLTDFGERQMYQWSFWNSECHGLANKLGRFGLMQPPKPAAERPWGLEPMTIRMLDGAIEELKILESDPEYKETHIGNYPTVYAYLKKGLDAAAQKEFGTTPPADEQAQYMTIASELGDQIPAGFDTSAVTLTYIVYELSKRPDLQAALRSELRSLTAPLSYASAPHIPPFKDLDALPLLQAITQETLRRYPALPGSEPRVTPSRGCTLGPNDEYQVPGNVRVSAQVYSVHRNAEVFPEPESWRPERWLDGDGMLVKDAEMTRWFWAFSSGQRMCIGHNLAVYEIKNIIAAIYTNFSVAVVDETGIEPSDGYASGPRGRKLMVKLMPVDW